MQEKLKRKEGVLFVGDIPLFLSKRNLARQLKVELWLSTELAKDIAHQVQGVKGEQRPVEDTTERIRGYIV